MANLAKYVVQLEAQTATYQRKLDAAEKKLGRFNKSNSRNLDSLKRGFGKLAAVVSVGLFARYIKSTIESVDAMGKLVDRLGGSTEAFSELAFVAELSGVNVKTLNLGLQRMTRRVAEAAQGTGEAKGALAELGLEARSLARLSLDRQFEVLADALHGVGSASDRTRLAMKLFDSEGVALLQTMTRGAAGIQEMRLEARRLGVSLSGEQVAAATAANDALTRFNASISSIARDLVIEMAPALEQFARGLKVVLFGVEQSRQLAEQMDRLREQIQELQRVAGPDAGGLPALLDQFAALARQLELLRNPAGAAAEALAEIDISETLIVASERLAEFNKMMADAAAAARAFNREWDLEQRLDAAKESIKSTSDELDDFIELQADLSKDAAAAADDAAQAARDLGLTFASAFEDAIVNGESFRDVLKGILQDLIRLTLRKAITEPVANWLGGVLGSAFGGPKAAGGPVSSGQFYQVNEQGQEFFSPAVSGNITPAGGGGGMVFNIDASGGDADKFISLVPAIIEQSVAMATGQMYNLKAKGRF